MNKNNIQYISLLILLLFQLNISSQERERIMLRGRITSEKLCVENIYIHNKTYNHLTVSNIDGHFTIPVKVNDTLVFYGIQFSKEEIIIEKPVIDSKEIVVKLKEFIYELEEVVIKSNLTGSLSLDIKNVKDNSSKINSRSLNLPNSKVPKKTPLELKIYSLEANMGDIHNFINAVSGRTKKNNKVIKILIKENEIKKVFSSYSKSIYTDVLNIPEDEIDSFITFCENNNEFWETIKLNDKIMILNFIINEAEVFKKEKRLHFYKIK